MKTVEERKAELSNMAQYVCKKCGEKVPDAHMSSKTEGVCDWCDTLSMTTPQVFICAAWAGFCVAWATGGVLF